MCKGEHCSYVQCVVYFISDMLGACHVFLICTCRINHRLFSKMTMEIILATAFGRSMDVQGGAGGKILESAYEVFASLLPGADDKPRPFILFLQIISSQFTFNIHTLCLVLIATRIYRIFLAYSLTVGRAVSTT